MSGFVPQPDLQYFMTICQLEMVLEIRIGKRIVLPNLHYHFISSCLWFVLMILCTLT